MVYDLTMLKAFYSLYEGKIGRIRTVLQRPLTLAEKILYAHLYDERNVKNYKRGEDYVNFRPDRVAMQDATAQMALLQFMNSGRNEAAVPSTVHCDHLIQAYKGAKEDIATATKTNEEVYRFLRDVSSRYGIGFWQPGAGIIHQVVLENYAFPGGMMIGTDSHTPNAGGLGMVAIGVGGADAVDVMTGMEWELKMPRLIGVRLTGSLSGWAAPKDVILKLAGILTVKGGTNAVIEYFGPGTASLSATGKATICNMGAEVGATTSLFPYDERMATYLKATGREEVADMATAVAAELRADDEVMANPQKYYDRIIDIDLSALEPYINGPFTPDAATPISEFSEKVLKNGYPRKMEVGLIGSCTNSSYQDLSRAVSLARQVTEKNLHMAAPLIVNPGSESFTFLPSALISVSFSGLKHKSPAMVSAMVSSGEATNAYVFGLPSARLAKLRLKEVTMEFLRTGSSVTRFHCPIQGPQAFAMIVAPTSSKTPIMPSRSAVARMRSEPGLTIKGAAICKFFSVT